MARAKPDFIPDPRTWADYQLAARFNWSEGTFKKRRPELEAMGFPKFDEELGGTDSKAAEAWWDRRSGLTSQAADNDTEWMEALK